MFYQRSILRFIIEIIIFVIIVLIATNCKKTEDEDSTPRVPPVTKFIGQNIIPIVGASFGSGVESNNILYKTISIAWKGTVYTDLKVSKAYIQKPDILGALRFSYVIPVDNVSDNHAYCNVRSSGLTFLNSEFNKIYGDDIDSKAYSSIGLSNSTDWEHCIKPGGTGYIVGTVEALIIDPFENVRVIELGIVYGSDSVVNSGAKVEASSYVVNGDWLDVSVKNNGYDTAYIWPYTSIVLVLDANDAVMQWNYLNVALRLPTEIVSTVGSADPLPILKSKITFKGTANRAKFLLTFSTSKIYPF